MHSYSLHYCSFSINYTIDLHVERGLRDYCNNTNTSFNSNAHTGTHNLPTPSSPSQPLLLSPSCRLSLALGITEDLPGCSCKQIKEALTVPRRPSPQSGLYWIILEEGCRNELQKRAVKVGQLTLVQLVRQHAGTGWREGSGGGAAKTIFTQSAYFLYWHDLSCTL